MSPLQLPFWVMGYLCRILNMKGHAMEKLGRTKTLKTADLIMQGCRTPR